jgi:hypothetical protein
LARPRLGRRGVAVLAAIVLALGGWIWLRRSQNDDASAGTPPPPAGVLAAIPEGALLVAVVDVTALRRSPLGERLLGRGRAIPGLGDVAAICGADPMAVVDELAFAVPAGFDAGFGLFAAGPIDAAQLLGCAEGIVRQRGGRPARSLVGRFGVLRDDGTGPAAAELAAADGGPVVLAEEAYVSRALELAGGRGRSAADEPAHRELRGLVEPGVLVATLVLGSDQLAALEAELRAQGADASPLRALRAGALSVRLDGALLVHAVARCQEASACAELADRIDEARHDEARTPAARAIGLAAVLEELVVEPAGEVVHIRATIPLARAADILERIMLWREIDQAVGPAPTSVPTVAPSASARPR